VSNLIESLRKVYMTDDTPAFPFMSYRLKYDVRLVFKNKFAEMDRHTKAASLSALDAIAADAGVSSRLTTCSARRFIALGARRCSLFS